MSTWLSQICVCLWLFLLNCALGQDSGKLIVKDGRLEGLAHLLNSVDSKKIFQRWNGSNSDTAAFLKLLEPWILHDNAIPMRSRSSIDATPVDCANAAYSSTLSGAPMQMERLIVDFVPFGYDVDKLLIRFHETAAYVDVFVVYEMPFTLLGNVKPLFFDRIRHQPRFKDFVSKVIYVNPDVVGMLDAVRATQEASARFYARKNVKLDRVDNGVEMGSRGQRGESENLGRDIYSVMHFFNKDLMAQFKRIGTFAPSTDQEKHNDRLKAALTRHLGSGGQVYAVQNDGDEFVNGQVLRHMRQCELLPEVKSIFAPCFGFKNNYHWLQTTFDMRHFTAGQQSARGVSDLYKHIKLVYFGRFFGKGLQMELNKYIWRLGPFLWPLQTLTAADSMMRRNFTQDRFFNHHMGYGAATHMSAVNEPAELWYKACGTVEMVGACERSVPTKLREAAAAGRVTPQLIYESVVFPWCHRFNKGVHTSTLSRQAQRVVSDAIPWVVRNNPTAFPFMFPIKGLRTTGLYERVADPAWVKECGSSPVGIVDT